MNLTTKVLIALIFGTLAGLLINISQITSSLEWVNSFFIDGIFHVIGTIFINALKMLVVPLVIFSLIPGIVGIGDIKVLGRVGGKSFVLYMATTAIAISSAILLADIFAIGDGISVYSAQEGFKGSAAPPVSEVLINIVPSNPIAAMANGDMLAIIFFAILFGISLLGVQKDSGNVIKFAEQMNLVMMKMVELIMYFSPIAVFCLIAKSMAELGLDLLVELLGYVVVLSSALLLHAFVTLMLLLKFGGGLEIGVFLKKIRTAQLFAFSTASSGATIPVTMRTAQERLGVDRSISSFTVPFGATINMDGTAMMQGAATVFIANVYGMDLGLIEYVTVVVMAVLASIGTAAVPGVGLVMLTLVFNQMGIPVEGIGLILGIDRLLDMLRTAVNVTGDAVVTSIVAKTEKKLDLNVYSNPQAGVIID